MWYLFLVYSLLNAPTMELVSETSNLTINVTGIDKVVGQLGFCLISNEADYPDDCTIGKWVDIEFKDFSTTINNIPNGRYAIAIYQDKNGDKELNKNFLGIPKEKYGFSNNPDSRFGLPDFNECVVIIDQDKSIVIDM